MSSVALQIGSHADVLRGSPRVSGAGTRDEPLRKSSWGPICNKAPLNMSPRGLF